VTTASETGLARSPPWTRETARYAHTDRQKHWRGNPIELAISMVKANFLVTEHQVSERVACMVLAAIHDFNVWFDRARTRASCWPFLLHVDIRVIHNNLLVANR